MAIPVGRTYQAQSGTFYSALTENTAMESMRHWGVVASLYTSELLSLQRSLDSDLDQQIHQRRT
jgi:hypothetical protein